MTRTPYLLALIPVLAAGAAWPGPPPPALAVAVLAALLAALLAAGRVVTGLLLPDAGGGTRWTATFVFATVFATLPATLLGHFGLLSPDLFLSWAAALALLSWATALARRPGAGTGEHAPPPADGETGCAVPPDGFERFERVVAIATMTIVAVSLLGQLRADRYAPSGTYGFDDNSYHLSAVATWLETGDLSMIRFDYGDPSTPFYPITGELVAWALLAPFRISDVAARWGQLPFALASLAAMAALGRRLGLRLRHTLPALVLYGSLYRVFPLTALAAGNDHAVAFFTLASVDGLLTAARRGSIGAGIYAGTALGLLVGTKYLGVFFLGPVLAVGVVAWLAGRSGEAPRAGGHAWPVGRAAVAAVAAAGLAGGYTYLRNWITVDNPVFPLPVTVGGHELLAGWATAPVAWLREIPEAAIDLPEFLFRHDLWGTAPPWLLVTAAVAAPIACAVTGRPGAGERVRRTAVLLLPAVLFVIFLFLVHDHRDIRYLLPAIAIAALAWTWLASWADAGLRGSGPALRMAAYGAALASLFEWQELPPAAVAARLALGVGLGASVVWGPLAWPALGVRMASILRSPAPRRAAGAAVLFAAGAFVTNVATRYPERKLELRTLPRWLEEDAGTRGIGAAAAEPPITVAYVGFNTPYLYWGSRLQNRVVIVPTSRGLARRLYSWGRPVDPSFPHGRYSAWSENLTRLGVDYVVVVREGGENPERRWLSRHPERFEKATVLGRTEIWRVSRPERSRR